METSKFFCYSWHLDERENDQLIIRVFGLNERNESVYVLVDDFTPFVYLELPDNVRWSQAYAQILGEKLDEILGKKDRPLSKTLVYKKKLYYAHKETNKDGTMSDKMFPYLFCNFNTQGKIKKLGYALKKPIELPGIGSIRLKVHENMANPILQLCCIREIPSAGWVQFKGRKIVGDDKESLCDHEYIVHWKNLFKSDQKGIVKPLILSFDIECNSSNPSKMPNPEIPGDKIFQISCVFGRQGDPEDTWKKVLLSLGEPDPDVVGDDVELRYFSTETDLLIGYVELIHEMNPQVICGYNILSFDIPYMLERSRFNFCYPDLLKQGFIPSRPAVEKTIKWSSSAYKNQEFKFIDAEGRLFVDLLPLIKRDYKFDNYRLKTVSDFFLGETKDPLTPKGIFKCYRIHSPKSLGIVGKYCVQDANLVLKLFEVIHTWIGLCEMASICNVPIFYLYTQGQQIKVFSQVYKKCMYDNRVVETDGYVPGENESYTGAYVFDPVPGLYDMVVSFDFSSLYPTTIIAYNIDYSTLVKDVYTYDRKTGAETWIKDPSISDEQCHLFEWDDHTGCEHDQTVRKTKVKNVICDRHKYRFLKEPKGVLPTILQNLLDARKATNRQIDQIKEQIKEMEDGEEKDDLEREVTVLDKRQLALKVSANSMYGGMGVKRGYLPFMPGAMCTTARGRQSIDKAARFIRDNYEGKIIYGDTDSVYVNFPHLKTPQETWDFCMRVQEEMLSLYPRPMKLAFEEKIYWRYFILTKKRYMALTCDTKGKVSNKIFKRGVLLARRDNSKFLRDVYGDMIMKIFYKEPEQDVTSLILDRLNQMFAGCFDVKNFVVTKSVGEVSDYAIRPLYDLSKDYDRLSKELPKILKRLKIEADQALTDEIFRLHKLFIDNKLRPSHKTGEAWRVLDNYLVNVFNKNIVKKLEENGILMDHHDKIKAVCDLVDRTISGAICDEEREGYAYLVAREYIGKCLPAQVQLAERMRRRGKPVDPGTRLEYVVSMADGHDDRLFNKMEDVEYFNEHKGVLAIDYLYYLKLAINPMDQALEVAYKLDDFMLKQYKLRIQKMKVMAELRSKFSSDLLFD